MTHLEQIYLCALRYGLSRRSYITGVISDYLLVQELSDACKNNMIRDIEECKDYGHDCDKESWMKLLKKLKEDLIN